MIPRGGKIRFDQWLPSTALIATTIILILLIGLVLVDEANPLETHAPTEDNLLR